MAITFNADEIFEMAEEIERNGAKFYRQAAGNAADREAKQMLLDLAAMEDNHFNTFQEMRKQLSGREKEEIVFDPDNQSALYLQAMADSRGWEGKISPTEELTGSEKMEDVLKAAIIAEKDSVVFYVGLKDLVPAKLGQDKVEAIIKEEMGHIATLSQKLMALK